MSERVARGDAGAYVVAAAFDAAGTVAGFALGDGVLLVRGGRNFSEEKRVAAHGGGILAMARDEAGFLTAGDDGRLRRVTPEGEARTLVQLKGWVEQVAVWGRGRDALIACAAGRAVHLLRGDGTPLRVLEHPSAATGLAFDAKGKRLAVSHYNAVSLWFVNARDSKPRLLEWKGSHTGVAVHPGGEAVVSAMQENALHGWRLADGGHMRMSGYPAKTESMAFTANGRWLATGGAEALVLWPFFGGGPMGKAPLELAAREGAIATRVAAHPKLEAVATGFADRVVTVSGIASRETRRVGEEDAAKSPITALAWDAAGTALAWGREDGGFSVLRV